MPRTEPAAAPRTAPAAAGAPRRGRALLTAGAVVTLASALSLVGVLVAYFLTWPVPPALLRVALFGLPVGFLLLIAHLVLSAVARSRL